MVSRYPRVPFKINNTTQVCDRIAILNDLSNEGTHYPEVRELADSVYRNASTLAGRFEAAAASNESIRSVMGSQDWFAKMLALEGLRTVQSLPYRDDPPNEEWFKPADYVAQHGGDCDGLTVLLVSIYRILGLKADPAWITQTGHSMNHVTTVVQLDGQSVWAEPAIRGAMLGESPYEAAARQQDTKVLGSASPTSTAPAGQARGGRRGGGRHGGGGYGGGFGGLPVRTGSSWRTPFNWYGWNTVWSGWPSWWWYYYYPYLYVPYQHLVVNPHSYGFYRVGYPYRNLVPARVQAGTVLRSRR